MILFLSEPRTKGQIISFRTKFLLGLFFLYGKLNHYAIDMTWVYSPNSTNHLKFHRDLLPLMVSRESLCEYISQVLTGRKSSEK